MNKERYILMLNEEEVGRASSMYGIAKLVGCDTSHLYKRLTAEKTFSFKKITYKVIDRLD